MIRGRAALCLLAPLTILLSTRVSCWVVPWQSVVDGSPTLDQHAAERVPPQSHDNARPAAALARSCGSVLAGLLLGLAVALAAPQGSQAAPAAAAEDVQAYFGNGCFWHVQAELLDKERSALRRSGASLTALTGYAGGRSSSEPVCYHNASKIPDYAEKGYAEVVAVTVPGGDFQEFVKFHLKAVEKFPTPIDGPLRNVIGLPGGMSSPLYSAVRASGDGRVEFVAGVPGIKQYATADKNSRRVVHIYDSNEYPFRPAELYHQYFGLDGRPEYSGLKSAMLSEKRIARTGCPESPNSAG